MVSHTYRTHLAWSGSTATGYREYDRSHTVVPEGVSTLELSADKAFRGDPRLVNPEQLLLAAASSCQLLSFLAVAARTGLDIIDYTDGASALMPEDDPPTRITEITLRPRITVRGGEDATVRRLADEAHEQCYIANSLSSRVHLEVTVEHANR